jgi:spore germination protein
MIIHVVKSGETIYSIANNYGVPLQKIIDDNELEIDEDLVVGQTLVILIPDQVYTVVEGDTLQSVARAYGTTTIKLLQNNPFITTSYEINPGDEIVINYKGDKLGNVNVHGYAYPFIRRDVLIKTLPYLTSLAIFTYGITRDGDLISIDDQEIIQLARDYGVAPLMVISTLTEDGIFSNELASLLLNNQDIQDKLIANILKNLKEKKYYGLDVDFEYILPKDRDAYAQFIENLTSSLNEEGFEVMVDLAPKTSADQVGLLYESHDYDSLGEAANKVLLMTYEWGYTYGPPMAVSPINKVREVLDYAVTAIDPNKIYMGIPNYGYDFLLPYIKGVSQANPVSNVEAVDLARKVGANINFDELSQAPYFVYFDMQGKEHNVWFEDARSIRSKLDLFSEYGLDGISFWTIMKYFPQSWLVLNGLYEINKII